MDSLKSPCEPKRLEKRFISTWGPSDAAGAVRIDFNFYFLPPSISFTLGVQKYKRKKNEIHPKFTLQNYLVGLKKAESESEYDFSYLNV